MLLLARPLRLGTWALLLLAAGCSAVRSAESDADVDNGFESDDPSGRRAERGGAGGADAGAGTTGGTGGANAPGAESSSGDDAARAVAEADILKVDGDRVYALSRFGGLAVVDITNPDAMKLLGRKRMTGEPFEMYVQGGRAHVMLNAFGRYVRGDNGYGQWVQTSELVSLDVADPANIREVSSYDVPGSISDSRMVGDALYLVTHEDGHCWRCSERPGTFVTSFAVTGPAIAKVDQLAFQGPSNSYSYWRRSVSATAERLYIAGPSWSWSPGGSGGSSVIQVVDIRDPQGHLVRGADVPIDGQISSRWQMDEHAGVLRVVSQYDGFFRGPNNSNDPRVQTFAVKSASDIQPLGATSLRLPKPESLRSVRFDGTRGYAITAERTDPLFTIDLSDPAAPKQMGELEMPGWVFHMEPRGDRLVGFGYEDTTWQSRLAVSLFDVSDLTAPKLLSRVPFGKASGGFAEDQDRIHKSVRLLDEQGLILVPFASYGSWGDGACRQGESGIQLLDWTKDGLTLRGVAPQWGMPRRALMAKGRLFAVSDRNVTTFDVTSRDAPQKKHELDLSTPAYRMAELPEHIASLSSHWWSGEVMLTVVPKNQADDAATVGKVSLADLAEQGAKSCGRYGWAAWYNARLLASGSWVYVAVPVHDYGGVTPTARLAVAAVDVSNPEAPKVVGKTSIPLDIRGQSGFYDGYAYYSAWGGSAGVVGSGESLVQVGSKLAYLENYTAYNERYDDRYSERYGAQLAPPVRRRLHVIDFAAPSMPRATAVDLGDSLGVAPLLVQGNTVLTSRWTPSDRTAGKVRFFAERVDLGGPLPRRLAAINIPGSLLHLDEPSSRWVTTDYAVTRTPADVNVGCMQGELQSVPTDASGRATYECVHVHRTFKLVDVAGTRVSLRNTFTPPAQTIAGVQLTADRIYITHLPQHRYTGSGPRGMYQVHPGGLWVIGGIRAGALTLVSRFDGDARWPLAAHGTKVALATDGGLAIYDTATPEPRLVAERQLQGYGYTSHVLLSERRAIASLGEWGLQSIDF